MVNVENYVHVDYFKTTFPYIASATCEVWAKKIDTDSKARSSPEFSDIMEISTCERESFNAKKVLNRKSWLKEQVFILVNKWNG